MNTYTLLKTVVQKIMSYFAKHCVNSNMKLQSLAHTQKKETNDN